MYFSQNSRIVQVGIPFRYVLDSFPDTFHNELLVMLICISRRHGFVQYTKQCAAKKKKDRKTFVSWITYCRRIRLSTLLYQITAVCSERSSILSTKLFTYFWNKFQFSACCNRSSRFSTSKPINCVSNCWRLFSETFLANCWFENSCNVKSRSQIRFKIQTIRGNKQNTTKNQTYLC